MFSKILFFIYPYYVPFMCSFKKILYIFFIVGLLCVYLIILFFIYFSMGAFYILFNNKFIKKYYLYILIMGLLCVFNYLYFKLHQLLSFLVKLVLCLIIILIQVGPLMNISHYRLYLQQLFKIYY